MIGSTSIVYIQNKMNHGEHITIQFHVRDLGGNTASCAVSIKIDKPSDDTPPNEDNGVVFLIIIIVSVVGAGVLGIGVYFFKIKPNRLGTNLGN